MQRANFRRALQRGDDHPVEREENDEAHENQKGINHHKAHNASHFLGFFELFGILGFGFDHQMHFRGVDRLVFGGCFALFLFFGFPLHLEKLLEEIAVIVSVDLMFLCHISNEPSSSKL